MADGDATVDTGADTQAAAQGILDGTTESTETTTEGGKTYTEAEYKQLQKENQGYRERWGAYEKTYQNPDTQVFHTAAQLLAEGRGDEVQSWILENAANAIGTDVETLLSLTEKPEEGGEPPLTRAEVAQMLQEVQDQQAQSAQQREVNQVLEAAKDLGYTPGSREAQDLLYLASHETNGDLEKAHEMLTGERQRIIDEYLEGRRQEARGNLTPGSNGSPVSGAKTVTMENAREAAQAILDRSS